MEGVRRQLRACAFVWLLCQTAFLSAFVPRDCCAAHRSKTAAASSESHKAAAAPHCPMRAADGDACPMHQDAGERQSTHRGDAPTPKEDACRLGATCDGPLALAHLFSLGSMPGDPLTLVVALPDVEQTATLAEHAIDRAHPPDSPPPRL